MEKHIRAIWTVIILRISGYIYMLFAPLPGFLLSIFLDWIDWFILVWSGIEKKFYHKLDKPLDYLCYIFLIPFMSDTPLFPLYLGAMLYRALGYVAYYSLKDQRVFVLFADFPQVVVILHFIKLYFIPGLNIFDIRLLVICFSVKMFSELFHHVFNPGMTYQSIRQVKAFLTKKNSFKGN